MKEKQLILSIKTNSINEIKESRGLHTSAYANRYSNHHVIKQESHNFSIKWLEIIERNFKLIEIDLN